MIELSLSEKVDLAEHAEVKAFTDIFAAAPPELGCRLEPIGAAVALIAANLPVTLFNLVLCFGLEEHPTIRTTRRVLKLYKDAHAPIHAVQLSPIYDPSNLPAWLKVLGYERADSIVKMIRRATAPVPIPTALRIEPVIPDQALDFANVAAAAFGMPPIIIPWMVALVGRPGWQHFMAYDDSQPVATGSLYIQDKVGWLGNGGTLPSHRNQGAQGALLARRIQAAAEAGCNWVITETGAERPDHPNPSYHNMLRTGFELAYERQNYLFSLLIA